MLTPRIRPLTEIGANRPLCQHKVRVVADFATIESRRAAYRRQRAGIPIDQCGQRGDFRFDGVVLCRSHAGQEALRLLLVRSAADAALPPPPPCGCTSICAGDRCPCLPETAE